MYQVLNWGTGLFCMVILTVSSCGIEDQPLTTTFGFGGPSNKGLCAISEKGSDYIKGLLPPEKNVLTDADVNGFLTSLDQVEQLSRLAIDDVTLKREFREAMRDFRKIPENANWLLVQNHIVETTKKHFPYLFEMAGEGGKLAKIGKVLSIFQYFPYLSVLSDLLIVFSNNCSESEAVEAISNFVADSIITATNRNLHEIWANSNLDAKDELNKIQDALITIQRLNQAYLPARLKFVDSQEVADQLIANHQINLYSNHYIALVNSVKTYVKRYQEDPKSIWGLKHAVPFKKLVELSLTLWKRDLTAARSLEFQNLVEDKQSFAELAGTIEVAFEDFKNYVNFLKDASASIAAHNRQHGISANFLGTHDVFWSELNNVNYTIKVKGQVVVNLFGDRLKTFSRESGQTLNLIDLMEQMPLEDQPFVPKKKLSSKCGISKLKLFTCGHPFNRDLAWPGEWIHRSAKHGFPPSIYVPYKKWLGMGKKGFIEYMFKTAKVHEDHFLRKDKEVAEFTQDLLRIGNETAKAFEDLTMTLASIQTSLESCPTDIWSLYQCQYFQAPIADEISKIVRESQTIHGLLPIVANN